MNRRKISLLMVLVMLFSFCPGVSENKAAKALTNKSRVSLAEETSEEGNDETNSQLLYGNSGDSSIFSGKTFKITYHITGKWEDAYNASITIENLSDEVIHDWALLFYLDDNVINNIWNAKVANKDNGLYLLDNNDWNMDILAKQSVSFGFTAEYGKGAILPGSYALTTCQGDVLEADYSVHYRVDSNGGGELAAAMEIENKSDSIIEDWSLTFDYENEIHNLWCGDLQTKEKKGSQYHYLVNNPGWSQNIEPEQRVTVGFLADSSTLDAVPKNYSMKKYSNEINYDRDSDGDELTDVDEVILGTNPYDSDTDGDGLSDGMEELYLCLNPLKPDTDDNGIKDGQEDTDEDGINNIEELKIGCEPWNEDTDEDGLLDGEELLTYKTDPLQEDTDTDTLSDYDEIKLGLNPLVQDSDGNGVRDDAEKIEQSLTLERDEEDTSAVAYVSVDAKMNGNIDNTTQIENIGEVDTYCNGVVGKVGFPVEITSTSQFDTANITFGYDTARLGDTKEDDLCVMCYNEQSDGQACLNRHFAKTTSRRQSRWYNEAEDDFVLLEEQCVLNKSNHTVTCTTPHFSKYLLVDKKKWRAVWENAYDYRQSTQYHDVLFSMDISGSMKGNPLTYCKKAVKGLVDSIYKYDRMGLMTFSASANYVQKFTSSSKKLYNKIDSIACKGATDKEVGLKESVDCFTKNYQSTGNKKNIILLCDGAINYKEDVIQKAKQNQIAIHVILIGENQAREEKCKKIANETGGSYYLIKKESEIEGTVAKLGKQLLGTIDTTDTDQDGIYDVFEKHGVLAANGQLIKSDYQKKDTDGDGLSDFYEWMGTNDTSKKLTKKTVTIKAGEKEVGVYSTSYYSNPANKDTDGDGYNDKVDKTPKKNSITEYNLKSPGYVQVYRDGVRTYGGNQEWFNDKKLDMCNNYMINKNGCGLIACTDVTLYLRLGKKVKGKEDKDISQLNDGGLLIQSDAYMGFVRDVMKNKLKLHSYGMSDGQVKRYFNKYFKKYDIKLKAKHAKVENLLGHARISIKKNMPLITSSGEKFGDAPNIVLYKKLEKGDEGFDTSKNANSKFQFVNSKQKMNEHYVAITGLLFDEQTGKRMVKVSSWAEAYYIDYDMYYDYIYEQGIAKTWQSGVVYFK